MESSTEAMTGSITGSYADSWSHPSKSSVCQKAMPRSRRMPWLWPISAAWIRMALSGLSPNAW